jgi:subtilisin-like proprotein convertase family protein
MGAVLAASVLCLPLSASNDQLPAGQLKGDPGADPDESIAGPASTSLATGPDAAGYTAKDSTEPGGPTFSFVDISATGTQLTFYDADALPALNADADNGVAPGLPLGFTFGFYGGSFTSVNMSTNGHLNFTLNADSDNFTRHCPIPNAVGPNNMIAALWDNLVLANPPSTAQGGYTQQFASCPNTSGGTGACTVFMWDNADRNGGAVESFDFEAILYANGKILTQYGSGNSEAGLASTTGLENVGGTAALLYACNTAASIPAGRAVLFTPAPASLASAGRLLISEFRFQGPGGDLDEFVEIYNNSDVPLTVGTADGSAGYALAASSTTAVNVGTPTIEFIIPNGTIIPARGHYLGVNSVAYSLGAYPAGSGVTAAGDVTYTDDIPVNAGIALFRTANVGSFTLANRLDAAGSDVEANPIYREGAGYPAPIPLGIEYTWTRRLPGGCIGSAGGTCTTLSPTRTTPGPTTTQVQDTNHNANDFIFMNTGGSDAGVGQRVGAPGPENLSSPISLDGLGLVASKLDSCEGRNEPPNHVRDRTSPPDSTSQFGTIDIRRTFTNTTNLNISRLRFRIVDITTFPAPSGVADLRARTSADLAVTVDRPPCDGSTSGPTVRGTTVEEPPAQFVGSGFNGSLAVNGITPGSPLGAGASVDVRFSLGVVKTGAARFCVAAETLPATSSQILCFLGPVDGAHSSGSIATPIPDLSMVEIPIAVVATGAVTDVNVRVRLNHTFDGDVRMALVAPDNTIVPLVTNRGGTGDNYGTGANDCSGTPAIFDDSAAQPVSAGVAPFAGTFQPETPLSALNGKPAAGTWKLRVTDTAQQDTGTVGCVTLEIASVPWRGVRSDFNGNGSGDIAVYRPSTGQWFIRNQGGVQFGDAADLPVPGDYNGDFVEDIAVFRPSTGQWFVRGQFTVQWGDRGDVPVPGDFDGDGTTDVAVYRPSTGDWFVRNQFSVNFGGPGGYVPVVGDYNGDGTDDVAVFQRATGTWFIRNQGSVHFGDPGDRPVQGDYNDDGKTDIAVYRPSTGAWFVRNQFSVQFGDPGDVPVPRDYDGNGSMDVGIYRPSTHQWFVKDQFVVSFGDGRDRPVPLPAWIPLAIAGDHDGDGTADIAVHRPSTNQWFVRNQLAVSFGDPGDVPIPADYNGDRRMDVAVYRPSTGHWFVRNQPAVQWGDPSDKPVPGDYNGDGLMDVAVFRPSTGFWFVRNQSAVQFGVASNDIPVPGDYNGDGVTDLAIYRPTSGQWFVRNVLALSFGDPGDIPVPADYNGDGTMDLAVYRPSTGTWFVRNQFSVSFGNTGDVAVPGDYNGDGVTDIAVYRPSTGQWYVRNLFTVSFGDATYVPMVRIGGPQ